LEAATLLSDDDDARSDVSSVSMAQDEREAVEPLGWALMVYNSMIWWVSAGDRRSGLSETEEIADEQDAEMISDCLAEEATTREVAIIAYFHKLSTLTFSVLNSAVRRHGRHSYHDNENEEDNHNEDNQALLPSQDGDNDDNDDVIEITEEDIRAMGLDVWSMSDKRFVSEMLDLWWKRKATVSGGTIECCGIRVL